MSQMVTTKLDGILVFGEVRELLEVSHANRT